MRWVGLKTFTHCLLKKIFISEVIYNAQCNYYIH